MRSKMRFYEHSAWAMLDRYFRRRMPRDRETVRDIALTLVRVNGASREQATEITGMVEAMLTAARIEDAHNRMGRHYITIPDEETFEIVDSINVDKVNFAHLRVPYGGFALTVPDSKRVEEFRGMTPLLVMDKCDDDGEPMLRLNANPENFNLPGNRIQTAANFAQPLSAFSESGLDLITDMVMIEDKSDVFTKFDEGNTNLKRMTSFMLRLCVFVQACPDALKDGPGVNEVVTVTKTKNGKAKKTKKKVKRPESMFVLPGNYRKAGKAHWRVPHFRSLEHPRYKREDKDGNLLDVGEPGFVRMVPVKGSMVRGKLHHIDKNTELENEA